MTNGISVGFSPATTGTSGFSPVKAEAGEGNLFANLLSLLGAAPKSVESETNSAKSIVSDGITFASEATTKLSTTDTLNVTSAITGFASADEAAESAVPKRPETPVEAIVALAASLLGLPAPNLPKPSTASGISADAVSTTPAQTVFSAAPAVPAAGIAVDAAIAANPELSDPVAVVEELAEALGALDVAAATGQPVDPALQQKVDTAVTALARLLGLELPQTDEITSAQFTTTRSAATPISAPGASMDPLATIAVADQPAADVSMQLEVATDFSSVAPKAAASIVDTVGAFLGADATVRPTGEIASVSTASPVTDGSPVDLVDPKSPAGQLAAKILEIADRVEAAAPELAAKLARLAEELQSGKLKPEILQRLGIPIEKAGGDVAVTAALTALAAPKPETKPAAAPAAFSAPELVLPEMSAAKKDAATLSAPAKPEVMATPVVSPEETPVEPEAMRSVAPATAERPEIEVVKQKADGAPAAAVVAAKVDAAPDQPVQPATPAQPVVSAVAAAARAMHAAYHAPVQQINLPQVAFEMVRQFQAGNSRFQIRLDPPELGRIDVKMEVDTSGNVNARLVVERSETLDLMQRDQRTLERALAQAGLDQGKTNLEFSLRQNPFTSDGQQQGGNGRPGWQQSGFGGQSEEPQVPTETALYRGTVSDSGVNLFV